jgi:hypothetical protein
VGILTWNPQTLLLSMTQRPAQPLWCSKQPTIEATPPAQKKKEQ